MGSLLVAVKAKMAIHAQEKVRGLLDGEYGSVFKGRSMDFDDLREYVLGDDIKDIDWKATARTGTTHIRRYVAVRKHNILLVVDTGRNMSAVSSGGDNKRDVAVMSAGVMSYIAMKHGDLIGLVAGDSSRTTYLPFKGSSTHIEQVLRHIQDGIDVGNSSGGLKTQLEYIVRNMRRKMMLVVVSDETDFKDDFYQLVRRVRAQHEVLWITIGDASGLSVSEEYYDVDNIAIFPQSIRANRSLREEFENTNKVVQAERSRSLERLGCVEQIIRGDSEVVSGIFRLLERKRHAGF